jgi:hypothetical protein
MSKPVFLRRLVVSLAGAMKRPLWRWQSKMNRTAR